MSSGLVHRVEKRKFQPEHYVDVAYTLQDRDGDEDEKKNMAKRRDVEGWDVGGEAPNWLASPPHKSRRDTPFESSPPPVSIPTGPKASHRAPSRRVLSPIKICTICTPHNRSLSSREVHELAVLQTKVDNAMAGIGPSLRILTSIPKSIQLTVQQKQRVYAAQENLDLAVLGSKMGEQGGSGSAFEKAATTYPSQHDVYSRHDSDGWIILTLPPLQLADSIEGSLIARSMWMEVNSLLTQVKRPRVKISFSAADRETLRIDT